MLTTVENLRRLIVEAVQSDKTERVLTDETVLTLQQWIRNHKKVKQRALKAAIAELWAKAKPAQGQLFRGLGMTSADLSALIGRQIDKYTQREADPNIPGNKLTFGVVNDSIVYTPRSKVDSWTIDLKKAEQFASHDSDFRVVLAVDGTADVFRQIPQEVYEVRIVDDLFVGPWAWEKETFAFGPVRLSGVMWTDWYFTDQQRQQLVR